VTDLRYTLLGDGSSDQALIPILTWLLLEHGVQSAIQPTWADLGRLRERPRTLEQRIVVSLDLYPCDLLFVHRDAERLGYQSRRAEILQQLEGASLSCATPPAVCVVPVRMQEAWLLFDEQAVRGAAGNPEGKQALDMPPVAGLEDLPNPKHDLHRILRQASGLAGRRRQNFDPHRHARRVTVLASDFSPLRVLPAFRLLEDDVATTVRDRGWDVLS